MNREDQLVELVTPKGVAAGSMTVSAAHSAPGHLHRAFSVLLFDSDGRALLQKRASVKTRFPDAWGNTCCGHPAPGQSLLEAATARLEAELGLTAAITLRELDTFTYQATDPHTGRVEHEYDHVLTGTMPASTTLLPNPAEISALQWLPRSEIQSFLNTHDIAPWLPHVLTIATNC